MRPWRKLHAGIVNSDKLANVSDGAAWLFALLVVAQDDDGCYPWTPAKVRSLCVGRAWNGSKIAAFIKELVEARLVELRGKTPDTSMLHIIDGEAKNGKPRGDRTPFHYDPIDTSVTVTAITTDIPGDHQAITRRSPVVNPDQIRVDKSREDSPPTPSAEEYDPDEVCVGVDPGAFGDGPEQPRPAPRVPIQPPKPLPPRTAAEGAYAAFQTAFEAGNGGHYGDKREAGQAWFEYVTRPGREPAEVMLALATYFGSSEYADQRVRGLSRIGAGKWLAQWTDWHNRGAGGGSSQAEVDAVNAKVAEMRAARLAKRAVA